MMALLLYRLHLLEELSETVPVVMKNYNLLNVMSSLRFYSFLSRIPDLFCLWFQEDMVFFNCILGS